MKNTERYTIYEIAEILETDVTEAEAYMRENGLPYIGGCYTSANPTLQKILAIPNTEKMKVTEIASIVGKSVSYVSGMMRRLNIPSASLDRSKGNPTIKKIQAIPDTHKLAISMIARKVGKSNGYVRGIMRKHGIPYKTNRAIPLETMIREIPLRERKKLNAKEIAERIAKPVSAVRKVLEKHDIKHRSVIDPGLPVVKKDVSPPTNTVNPTKIISGRQKFFERQRRLHGARRKNSYGDRAELSSDS